MDLLKSISIIYVLIIVIIVLIKILLATFVSGVAEKKGYKSLAWLLFGFCSFIISFVIITSLPDKNRVDDILNSEALLSYKKLFDEGLISEKEYLDKKKEILDSIK